MQLDLFNKPQTHLDRIARQKEDWQICWNWPGPTVGGLVTFQHVCAKSVGGRVHYVFAAPARVLTLTETHCRVRYVGWWWETIPAEKKRQAPTYKKIPHPTNGVEFELGLDEIWVPVDLLHGRTMTIYEDGQWKDVRP